MEYTKFLAALKKFREQMPALVANDMVNYALDNLNAQHDVDGQPMKPRRANAPRNQGRRILKDTGDGDRSIRISAQTESYVDITANDYMEAHNVGATIKKTVNVRAHRRARTGRSGGPSEVAAHTREMNTTLPRRTFFAPSKELDRRIVKTLSTRLNKLLNDD
jgi:hypothetical protein